MTNTVKPHNTADSAAASLSKGHYSANAQVVTFGGSGVSNQTVLSLMSSGLLSMQSPESLTQTQGLVYPSLANAPVILPPGQGTPPQAAGGSSTDATVGGTTGNPCHDHVNLNGQYGGT